MTRKSIDIFHWLFFLLLTTFGCINASNSNPDPSAAQSGNILFGLYVASFILISVISARETLRRSCCQMISALFYSVIIQAAVFVIFNGFGN